MLAPDHYRVSVRKWGRLRWRGIVTGVLAALVVTDPVTCGVNS